MRKRWLVPAFGLMAGLGVLAGSAAPAVADVPALSMQAAVAQAAERHPLVANTRSGWQQAGERIRSARAGYYPTVRAGVNMQRSNGSVVNYSSRHTERAEISASQMLWDFGKVKGRVGQAETAQDVAGVQVLQALDQVGRSTAQAWLDVRRGEELDASAEQQLEAVQELAQLVRRRHAEGASAASDVSQARARVDAARVALLAARSQEQRARSTLMHLVGAAALPAIAGEPLAALEQACSSSDTTVATLDATAVQLARAQLALAERGVDTARAQRLPTVSLDASAGRGLNRHSRRVGEHGIDTSLMLNVSAPLYEGGSLQADVQAAVYGVQAAQSALEQAQLAVRQGLQDAVLQAEMAGSRAQMQQTRSEAMETTRELYQQQYLQLGTRSLLDLLNAEEEFHGARSDAIANHYDALKAGVDCLYYQGQLRLAFDLDVPLHDGTAQASGVMP